MASLPELSITTIALSLATLFVLPTFWVKNIASKYDQQQLPPGPKPLPIIGNLHQVPKSLQWLHYYNWSKEYGPVMLMDMAGQPMIILSSVKTAQDLLSSRSAQYSDRPRMVMAGEMVTKGMHMLLRPYDAQYRLHQRMEAPLLNARSAESYRPLQELESRQLLLDAVEGYELHGEKGVNPHPYSERAMASFIYCLLYGYRFKTGCEQELVDAQRVQAEFAETGRVGKYPVDVMPFLNYLPKPLAPWKRKAEELYALEENLHVGNLKKGLSNPGWNLSKSMKASKEAKGMSEVELAFDLGILADAALETSTMTLDWLVVACITQGQRWVAKARRIVDGVVGSDRLPQWEDRAKLVYIDAIVNELLRWRPAIIGGVPHFTKKADTYDGYAIPANTIMLANHYAIARDEEVFGPDSDSFIPERWLDEAGNLRNLPNVGFGFGRRICTGRHIALNGLFIQVARLMWAFNIDAGMMDGSTGARQFIDDLACTEGFSTKPLPFQAVFRLRSQGVAEIIRAMGTTHAESHAEMRDKIAKERKVVTL